MLFLALLPALVAASITNCMPSSVFQITQLALEPPTYVSANQNVSLTLLYTTPVEVDAGSVTTSITYNFIPITPTVEDLCSSVECPIVTGAHDASSWFLMPTGVRGTVTTKVVWTDINNTQLLCISTTLKSSWF
jgi:hypothetical protein